MTEPKHLYIKKRDGKIVLFDNSNISRAIFKAAKAVGGEDYATAESLANEVSELIRAKYGSRIPSVEDVQDSVEKVLVEKGHAKTAKAYILYRARRARIRAGLKVRKQVSESGDSTDVHLLVTPTTKEELLAWDRKRIIESLEKEADLSRELAEKVAANVEDKVINSGVDHVSTSLVRELIQHGAEHTS